MQDVGEGWWEGVNACGKRGLFPEAYVEVSTIYFMGHILLVSCVFLTQTRIL